MAQYGLRCHINNFVYIVAAFKEIAMGVKFLYKAMCLLYHMSNVANTLSDRV